MQKFKDLNMEKTENDTKNGRFCKDFDIGNIGNVFGYTTSFLFWQFTSYSGVSTKLLVIFQ